MNNGLLEIITNSYLVNMNIRNAYLLQTNYSKNKKEIDRDMKKVIKVYPDLQISNNYTEYQGPIISKHNYNNQKISDKKMGQILDYPCSNDWGKITGNIKHIRYRLYVIINNVIKILLITNKCLYDNKNKFTKLKTIYKQSLRTNEYYDVIHSMCHIKIKMINVKLEIEEISTIEDIIYKSICNIRLNKANKNNLLNWQVHTKRGYSQSEAMKLINSNELFIRNTIKRRVTNVFPTIDRDSVATILRNNKVKIIRSIGINTILTQFFINSEE